MEEYELNLPETDSGDTVYNPSDVPDISNEFATAAFRFGHSLIPNSFNLAPRPVRTKSMSCPVKDTFSQFEEFNIGSDLSGKAWQNMVRGIIEQESPRMDASINKAVLNFLSCGEDCEIPGGFGQDLAARNIQRGRDHGLQPYTKYRVKCNLTDLTDWATRPEEIGEIDWNNMKKVYTNVADIDLFVGGIAEISNDGLVGSTFGCLIGDQFRNLKSGDRFFFTHRLPSKAKESIRQRTLGDIICDNTDATESRKRVMEMGVSSPPNDVIICSKTRRIDLDALVSAYGCRCNGHLQGTQGECKKKGPRCGYWCYVGKSNTCKKTYTSTIGSPYDWSCEACPLN